MKIRQCRSSRGAGTRRHHRGRLMEDFNQVVGALRGRRCAVPSFEACLAQEVSIFRWPGATAFVSGKLGRADSARVGRRRKPGATEGGRRLVRRRGGGAPHLRASS